MKRLLAMIGVLAVAGVIAMTNCARNPEAAVAASFELDYHRLAGPREALAQEDRDAVGDAIHLIQGGEHSLALARLSSLNERNPANSSLRILTSYVLLQAGNLAGAFEEAEKAHAAPDRIAYKCWFLGKVAQLNGNSEVLEREVSHLDKVGDMLAEARELEEGLARR